MGVSAAHCQGIVGEMSEFQSVWRVVTRCILETLCQPSAGILSGCLPSVHCSAQP